MCSELATMKSVYDHAGSVSQGRFQLLPQQVRVDFEDGSAVVAPVGEVTIHSASLKTTIGDIIDIACKIFPKLCGEKDGGGGGTKPGCYTIIGPDGTTITICPPAKAA